MISAIALLVLNMTDATAKPTLEPTATDTLYAKLVGETASINWGELQPFFARGALLWINPELDLVAVALALAQDDKSSMSAWLTAAQVGKITAPQAEEWLQRDPSLWSVVVAPWVLVQEPAAA
jgi:hypothetical protein